MTSTTLATYLTLFRKAYRKNLQYRAAHMINNFASAIFGFVYIAIWQSATSQGGIGPYNAETMTWYIACTQGLLWITTFLTHGLGVPEAIRTGAVSLEMMRPVGFFGYIMSREAGHTYYNLWYRTVPLIVIFVITVGMRIPAPADIPALIIAIVIGSYTGLCLAYIVGLVAFWTIEVRWAHYLNHSLVFSIGGSMIPIEMLPGFLGPLGLALPFSSLVYYPTRIYLGLARFDALVVPTVWAVLLTVLCLSMTRAARRRLEVQGG